MKMMMQMMMMMMMMEITQRAGSLSQTLILAVHRQEALIQNLTRKLMCCIV